MATKGYYAEQVIRQLNGADIIIDEQADMRLIFTRLETNRNALIHRYYLQLPELMKRSLMGSFAVPFYANIQKDNKRNQYFTDLPAKVITLENDMGIYRVSFTEDVDNDFIRIPLGSMSLYRNSINANFEGRVGWELIGKKLYFPTLSVDVESYLNKELYMLLICDSAAIDLDEQFYIPAEFEEDIINQTYNAVLNFKNPQIGNTQFEGRSK